MQDRIIIFRLMLRSTLELTSASIHSTILLLTIEDAEILLKALKKDDVEKALMTLSHKSRYLSFIMILYSTYVKIMQTYTS